MFASAQFPSRVPVKTISLRSPALTRPTAWCCSPMSGAALLVRRLTSEKSMNCRMGDRKGLSDDGTYTTTYLLARLIGPPHFDPPRISRYYRVPDVGGSPCLAPSFQKSRPHSLLATLNSSRPLPPASRQNFQPHFVGPSRAGGRRPLTTVLVYCSQLAMAVCHVSPLLIADSKHWIVTSASRVDSHRLSAFFQFHCVPPPQLTSSCITR